MKLFIDDVRTPPDSSWTIARTYSRAHKILTSQLSEITHISFDHDLGEEKTGYDLACLVEHIVWERKLESYPIMTVHSANPVGRLRIMSAIRSIETLASQNRVFNSL
jgi:hypothetical protein